MIEYTLASRYARALSELASERGLLERIHREMELLADILMPDRGEINIPELLVLLGMPRIPLQDKIQITDVMLEKLEFTKEVGDFLNVLIAKRRVGLIGLIAERYHRMAAQKRGISVVKVETARALNPEQSRELQEALEEIIGQKVDLEVKENRDLLGGLRVRIGGTLIDGSVDGALSRLEQTLKI